MNANIDEQFEILRKTPKNIILPIGFKWCYSCKCPREIELFYNLRYSKWSATCHLCRTRKYTKNKHIQYKTKLLNDPLVQLQSMADCSQIGLPQYSPFNIQ